MRAAGLDVGSTTVKIAILEGDEIKTTRVAPTGYDPMGVCNELLEGLSYDRMTVTGYGRHLLSGKIPDCEVVTEIRAVAMGAAWMHPACRTILDIGGQDAKVISLDSRGRLSKFQMNDKCAAGTGRFLDVMAVALGYTLSEFVDAAGTAQTSSKINSMCTVFAESEVISEVARGTPREELSLGIHRSVAERSAAMLRRIPLEDDLLFCGGGARNSCLAALIEEHTEHRVHRLPDPQVVAAVGCARHALKMSSNS